MQERTLGSQGLSATAIGYGSMGISIAYGDADPAGGTAAIRRAHELGGHHVRHRRDVRVG